MGISVMRHEIFQIDKKVCFSLEDPYTTYLTLYIRNSKPSANETLFLSLQHPALQHDFASLHWRCLGRVAGRAILFHKVGRGLYEEIISRGIGRQKLGQCWLAPVQH